MTSLKNEVTVISKRIRTKNDIEKINPKEIIKEALELSPKEDEEGEIEKRKISEVLNEIKEKTIKEYLNSVSNKKIMEIKDELNTRMEIYNKNMFAIIMKSKVELKETGLFTENDCLDILSLLSHLFRRLDDAIKK